MLSVWYCQKQSLQINLSHFLQKLQVFFLESDSDSLDSISQNSLSSETVTNFIACSRENRFDLDAILFSLNFLLSIFVFIIKMNQSNCFIFISVYFKSSYSKDHVKKVSSVLEVIIWSLGMINDPFCSGWVKECLLNIITLTPKGQIVLKCISYAYRLKMVRHTLTLIRLNFFRVVISEGMSVWPPFHISRRPNPIPM